MGERCRDIQTGLIAVDGRWRELPEASRRHMEGCPGCREAAARELGLARALAEAQPPPDQDLVARIVAAVPRRSPGLAGTVAVALGLAIGVVGLVLLGGLPGAGVGSLLPAIVLQSLLGVASAAGGAARVTPAVLAALARLIPGTVALVFAAAALSGVAGLALLTRALGRRLG